ncbi:salicylate hydroxylase [Penicillium fimorum]|uniref:Salicylate hydroxylase n=1 Tax=Penicillium fimorum TaxID=1882269 RepID=A0A9W9XIZ1_9EURO|nr:salicylate hydroxylase [Penicillium fimorum]
MATNGTNGTNDGYQQLDVVIVGGGIDGHAVATSLRRQGHIVTIHKRADFAGEVGASIPCAANGIRWLEMWKVDIELGDPVLLKKLYHETNFLLDRGNITGDPSKVEM